MVFFLGYRMYECLQRKEDSMNYRRIRGAVWGLVVVTLSGCGRLVDWGNSAFYQGESTQQFNEKPQAYVRSLIIYDQFSTVCKFDALWLSDAVRTAYAASHAAKLGKAEDFRINFLRRQLEENKHFISFYVLSDQQGLDEKDPFWSIFLRVNDETYSPTEVKIVELSPEYTAFFTKKLLRFRTAYRVMFNALNAEEKPILTKDVRRIALHVRSMDKEGMLVWDIPQESVPDVDAKL